MSNLAATAAITVGIFFLGCVNGYSIRDGAAKTAAIKAFKASEAERAILQERLNVVSAKLEAEREIAARKVVERTNTIREFYREAPPVDPSCAVPDRMYGVLANAVRDANVAAASEPSGELPKTSGAAHPSH